jgi:hypothetical protein
LLLFCWAGGLPAAEAEAICNDVPTIPGSIGYQPRHNAERCEGFYRQEVSGNLELLSLVNGPISYDLISDKVLTISTPTLPEFQNPQIFVTARALQAGTNYRMDAVIAPSGKFKWPLNEVLAPAKLGSDSIGVVAWTKQALGKYYVPVSVVPENVAASAARPTIMILRASQDIELLRWRIRREGDGASVGSWTKLGGESPAIIRAGHTVSLQIGSQRSGSSIVDVAVNYTNSGRPDPQLFRVIFP